MAINIYLENEHKAEIIAVLAEQHEGAYEYIHNGLARYAQKEVGIDFIISREKESVVLIENIDWKQLREQKINLLLLQESYSLKDKEIELLDGLVGLLDAMQDSAVDYGLTEEEVFGTLTEE